MQKDWFDLLTAMCHVKDEHVSKSLVFIFFRHLRLKKKLKIVNVV